jgi:CHC2 zinc finger
LEVGSSQQKEEEMADKPFLDFQAIKAAVSIAQVVDMLGLQMKGGEQRRSACPACQAGGDRALAVNTAKQSYFCFADGKGGDLIALCAHIRGVSQRDAAQEIATHFRIGQDKPASRQETTGGMKPLEGLDHAHDAVTVLGFEPADAEALGIGFCSKGIMRGLVAVPVRLADGTLAGYIGVNDIAKMPPRWQGLPENNVVPLQKKPA